jgi:hypothetical protein
MFALPHPTTHFYHISKYLEKEEMGILLTYRPKPFPAFYISITGNEEKPLNMHVLRILSNGFKPCNPPTEEFLKKINASYGAQLRYDTENFNHPNIIKALSGFQDQNIIAQLQANFASVMHPINPTSNPAIISTEITYPQTGHRKIP